MKEIIVGSKKELSQIVTKELLACNMGSGALEVFATPAMVAFMENCAKQLLSEFLDEGETCVGISINTSHISATLEGKKVTAFATITAVDRKKVEFEIEAFDEVGKIGSATHSRVVVNAEKFMANVNQKFE